MKTETSIAKAYDIADMLGNNEERICYVAGRLGASKGECQSWYCSAMFLARELAEVANVREFLDSLKA